MRRACASDLIVGGVAALLAGADVHLCRRGECLITDTLRRPVPKVALIVLTLHVLDVLGPLDPFRLAARHIPRSAPHA